MPEPTSTGFTNYRHEPLAGPCGPLSDPMDDSYDERYDEPLQVTTAEIRKVTSWALKLSRQFPMDMDEQAEFARFRDDVTYRLEAVGLAK